MSKTNKTTETQVEFNYETLLQEHKTVSAVIRYLASTGMSRGDISRLTGKRYQHVRNVLVTPLKKG
jgi:hypothetical protein